MLTENHPSVVAQPLTEHEWQVVTGEWAAGDAGHVMGFIEELGGTYEVVIPDQPALCQFFGTFKETMDYFERLHRGAESTDAAKMSASC